MSANPSAVAVLITSTDLFVGKTFVATGLARAGHARRAFLRGVAAGRDAPAKLVCTSRNAAFAAALAAGDVVQIGATVDGERVEGLAHRTVEISGGTIG